MNPPQVCGRRMRTLLLWVILGISPIVHSGFSNVVSQDEVYREAVTEGYLIDGFFQSTRATALPKRPEAAEASQQPPSQSKDGDVFDERLGAFHNVSTTEGAELHQSSQQPTIESKDYSEGSGDFDYFFPLLPDHKEFHASTTTSDVLHQSSQQPTTETKDYSEGSGYSFSDFIPPLLRNHGGEHHASTTQSAELHRSTQQPTTESKDYSEGSGIYSDDFIATRLPDHREFHASTTTSDVLHQSSQQPTTKSEDYSEGSGYVFSDFVPLLPRNHGGENHTSTTQSTELLQSTQQPTTESNDKSEGSGIYSDDFIATRLPDHRERHASTTESTLLHGSSQQPFEERFLSPVPTTLNGSVNSPLGRNWVNQIIESSIESSSSHNLRDIPEKVHESPQSGDDRTPGWVIIVAFIAGVAVLVMLCVAIATKDKWNGPNQASLLESKSNSSNQQRELEMETFLRKDHPRENGEAEEYTVIQLDDLPEKYPSD